MSAITLEQVRDKLREIAHNPPKNVWRQMFNLADDIDSALAQNAQGEAVLEIGECAEVIWHQGGPCQLPPGAKLYLHAERARVQDGMVLVPRKATNEMLDAGMARRCEVENPGGYCSVDQIYKAMLAVDPSQPESNS